MSQRRAGIIYFKADGVLYSAKGDFTYDIGRPKRDAIVGSDGVHGFKETPKPAFIEGEITDSSDLDLDALVQLEGVTSQLELANGKIIVLRDSWYAGDGTVNTGEGNIALRMEAKSGEEVR